MKTARLFVIIAILFVPCSESTLYQCANIDSNSQKSSIAEQFWVTVRALVFGCQASNATSRYDDTDIDYDDDNEEDGSSTNIGQSVTQVFHHLGITLGNALDSVLFLGIRQSPKAREANRKPVVAKEGYFQPCDFDQCYECGVPNPAFEFNLSRIISGEATEAHEFPWLASLHKVQPFLRKKFTSRSAFCGGTLINDLYVMTAGHCLYKRNTKHYFVVLGKHQRDFSKRSIQEQYFDVDKALIHKRFQFRNNHHDIGLIKLKRRVVFSQFIRPVCFPLKESGLPGHNLTIAGWGRTNFSLRMTPERLLKTQVTVVGNKHCRENTKWKTRRRHTIEHHMFCAFGQATNNSLVTDACLGDSGGPATLTLTSGQHIVQGIVSFGYHCGHKEYPGVYTRVAKYINWVGYRTRDACYCNNYN